ncbi:MAG: putative bifunctional diguanylate cyclase/phosphodiesterase, partial [Acidimicrobiales bacterium]
MADDRPSGPMPTTLWERVADRDTAAGASRSLRASLVVVLSPPLLALIVLTTAALLFYGRAERRVSEARQEIQRVEPGRLPVADAHLQEAIDQFQVARLAIAGGLLVALALAVTAAVKLNRRLVRPIRTAERVARRVYAGEVGIRLEASADGELGDLAAAMNAMASELDRSRPTLLAAAVVESAPDLVLVAYPDDDGEGNVRWLVRYASPAAIEMLGRPSEWLAGVPVAGLVHPDDRATLAEILADPAGPPIRSRGRSEVRFSHVQGRWVEAEVAAADLLDDPNVRGVALYARNLFERRADEEELRHLALHDPLTRLANRTLFGDRVEHALNRNRRSIGRPHAVMIVDLDGFKTINDSLGHAAGDEVLVELAERLRTRVRPGDTAARLGGDEFGVLLENSSESDAEVVALRILDAISGPVSAHDKEVVITGSVGIALSEPGQDAEALMRNADVAMYAAKAAGKGRLQMFRKEMQEAVARRLDLEADLRLALDNSEFVLHYQPIVDLAAGEMTGVEVLVRWNRPGAQLVYPGEFIAVAEESGLILPMGGWILGEACRQEQIWSQRFPRPSPLGVAVNVSAVQVDDPGFVDTVVGCLEAAGTRPGNLTLEITESLFMHDFDVKVEKLRRLRDLGVKVAIDDFGTGWSSFSRLKDMPIDILKIDKAFVDDVTRGV